jgi:hypothetical protein
VMAADRCAPTTAMLVLTLCKISATAVVWWL